MGSCAAPSAKGDDKFITTDYLQQCLNISTETREILRNYKAVINARRREMGQKPLTTAQIVDEICDFVANQQAVFLGGHYILQGSRNR